jgi:hypothetical protein
MNRLIRPAITRVLSRPCWVSKSTITRNVKRATFSSTSGTSGNDDLGSVSFSPKDIHYDTSAFDSFEPKPPDKLTLEMVEGISDCTRFFVNYGITNARLKALAQQTDMPAVVKWQKMMELFLSTQIHVLAGLGYSADEKGLTKYSHDLADCLQNMEEEMRQIFIELRRDTWRDLVATAFDLQPDQFKTLSIVDARNAMHKVSSKMMDPAVLEEIKARCSQVKGFEHDEQMEVAEKHRVVGILLYPVGRSSCEYNCTQNFWSLFLPQSFCSYNMSLCTLCTCLETRH